VKRALDAAFEEVSAQLPRLHTVVLSVAPDGVVAWAWSRARRPEQGLGFAALQRAVTSCIDALDGDGRLERLLLTSDKSWVMSRPLRDDETRSGKSHLVLTTAFSGELPAGMAMVQAARIRAQVRDIVDLHAQTELRSLRDELLERVRGDERGPGYLRSLCSELDLEPSALARFDQLDDEQRQRLAAWLERPGAAS